jgi:hypothetical protein
MHTLLVARHRYVDKHFRQCDDDGVTEGEAHETLDQVLEGVHRVPDTDDSDAAAAALEALAALHDLREQLLAWEPALIEAAREAGASWARLAPVLGVTSRQAAERRYLRLRPGRDDSLTREQRIQATRDERAGDRAVAAWARENAAELRQIAGQVSAVAGLTSAGRRDAKTLTSSLTEDDPSSLIVPLADMREHLVDEHARLAAQVDAVGQKVRRVRRETQRRRDTPTQS